VRREDTGPDFFFNEFDYVVSSSLPFIINWNLTPEKFEGRVTFDCELLAELGVNSGIYFGQYCRAVLGL